MPDDNDRDPPDDETKWRRIVENQAQKNFIDAPGGEGWASYVKNRDNPDWPPAQTEAQSEQDIPERETDPFNQYSSPSPETKAELDKQVTPYTQEQHDNIEAQLPDDVKAEVKAQGEQLSQAGVEHDDPFAEFAEQEEPEHEKQQNQERDREDD